MVEITECIFDRLGQEEFLTGREVALGYGSLEVFFGFGFVTVAEDEAEGVRAAEAAVLGCFV